MSGIPPPNQFRRPPRRSQRKNTNLIGPILIILVLLVIVWYVFLKKDGKLTEWSSWGNCSQECGDGIETRTRSYIKPKYGGNNMPDKDKLKETRKCKNKECPINGILSVWKNEGECSEKCGGGKQKQTRTYIEPKYGGIDPEGYNILTQEISCNTNPCPDSSAKIINWTNIVKNGLTYYYLDNKSKKYVDINKIPNNLSNQEFYYDRIRTFIKEGSKYKGADTLKSLLDKEKIAKRINDIEYKNLLNNGGNQIQTQKASTNDKSKFKYTELMKSWGSFSKCLPEKGKVRIMKRKIDYYLPTGDNTPTQLLKLINNNKTTLNDINKLSKDGILRYKGVTDPYKESTLEFKRVNNIEPKYYEITEFKDCDPIPYREIDDLKNIWQDSNGLRPGCKMDDKLENEKEIQTYLENILTKDIIDKALYSPDLTDFDNYIALWNKENIMKIIDINNKIKQIDQCYRKNIFTVTPEMQNQSTNKSILYPSLVYKTGCEWKNGNYRLVWQTDGNLVLYHTDGTALWSSGTAGNIGERQNDILYMQTDGNLVIYNGNNPRWSSQTSGNPGAYAELLSNGNFVIKNKDNNIIQYLLTRRFGVTNLYFEGSNNWKYAKNNSTKDIVTDWWYIKNNGTRKHIPHKVTLDNDSQPWGMTLNTTSDEERNKNEMLQPVNIYGVNMLHMAALNKLGERIYFEPSIYKEIIDKDDWDNSGDHTIMCEQNAINPIDAFNIDQNNFFTKLLNSSSKLERELFNNEKGRGFRHPYIFYKDFGAVADGAKNACSQWYWLAFEGSEKWTRGFNGEKTALEQDGFKIIPTTPVAAFNKTYIQWARQWLRNPNGRGSANKSSYWRVYYRSMEDYVNYLNSDNSPKESFDNKKSVFTNKLLNAYLEVINC